MPKGIFLLFFFIIATASLLIFPTVNAGVRVSPAKLVVTMENGYPKDGIQYKINITNPYSENITVSSRVINPFNLTANFTNIPDLSWVKVSSENLDIPAKSSKELVVFVDVPEGEKTRQYNKNWETWIQLTPEVYNNVGGVAIQIQPTVKLFIHTPTGTATPDMPQFFYQLPAITGIILVLAAIVLVFSYYKKKKSIQVNGEAMYYTKNKKNKDHKRN